MMSPVEDFNPVEEFKNAPIGATATHKTTGNRDEIIEQATQVVHVAIAHRWMTVFAALSEDHEYPELIAGIARALADADLLARPLPTREEITDTLEKVSHHYGSFAVSRGAEAILALLKGQEV